MPMKMARGVLCVIVLLLLHAICNSWSVSFSVFVGKDEAHQVLKIHKRANHFLEEIQPGNLERECIEETCSFEEAKEIFQSQEKTMEFWFEYKDLNPCKENPCKNSGVCKLKHYDYFCICPPRFGGKHCEIEMFECWYKNGGCWQYCQDTAGSRRVVCSCAEGYALGHDGKRCLQSAQFPCGLIKMAMRVLDEGNSGLSGIDQERNPRLNELAKRSTPDLNGTAEEGDPRRNSTAEGVAPGLNKSVEEGEPRHQGSAGQSGPGLSELAEENDPRLSGMAEMGVFGCNESAEEGDPRPSTTAEGGAPGLNQSVEEGVPRCHGSAQQSTPGCSELAKDGEPSLSETTGSGALGLNESAEKRDPSPTSTAESSAPGLKSVEEGKARLHGLTESRGPGLCKLAEESHPRLGGVAERGALGLSEAAEEGKPRLNGSTEGQNVPDDLYQTEAEGNLTDRELHGWINSYQAAEHDDARITSGSLCHRGHCPWQVLIRSSRGSGFCGGSLISSRWVVTAAHCLEIVRPHHVTLGDFDKHGREVKEQKIEVQHSWTHPHYDPDNYNGDIALLYLSSEAIFNEYVLPICLPNPNLATLLTAEGTRGMVSGWGSTYYKGPATRFLLKVKVPVVSMETCRKSTEKLITDNMFCAGYAAQAQDACKGDSGGPFAVSYRNTWYLLGIVSWGEGCAKEGKYGVYTRVANYIPWIKEVVENTALAGGV